MRNMKAFPVRTDVEHNGGMTLLDYFAAHAPAEPQPRFKPEMPPQPAIPSWDELTEEQKIELDENQSAEWATQWLDDVAAARRALAAWKMDLEKQSYTQWPYAWAREMMKKRDQP